MRILAISGSLRRDSYNTRLLEAAAEVSPPGVEIVRWDGLRAVPPFSEDDEVGPPPPAVASLRAAVASADGLLIATPEYNGSIPGQLKNALDWVSRPFAATPLRGKPVAVVGASTGAFGAAWAQADLRRVLATIGARVVQTDLALPHAHERFDPRGRLVDEDARARLEAAVGALVEAVEASRRPGVRSVAA